MRRFLVLVLVISGILSGCGNNGSSFTEVRLDKTKKNVKEFIEHVEANESAEGNGIYMFNDSEKVHYLYLNQEFLGTENGFGSLDIKPYDNSFNIYLSEELEVKGLVEEYKLYKIKIDEKYEYIKIFKNGEETNFQAIGG